MIGEMMEKSNEQKVEEQLLNTWQPVAAIAVRAGMHFHTALPILIDMYNAGKVIGARARIDAHNKVWCFKRSKYQKILGVVTIIDNSEDEIA